jgi:hypothetical protein
MRRLVPTVTMLVVLTACNNNHGKTAVTDTPPVSAPQDITAHQADKPDSSQTLPARQTPVDSPAYKKIVDIIDALPEIKRLKNDSSALAGTGNRFGYMITSPDSIQPDYVIQAGYDGPARFETRYIIHITPQSWRVRFLDIATDSLLTPEDFGRLKR